jgi:hypothetical protein
MTTQEQKKFAVLVNAFTKLSDSELLDNLNFFSNRMERFGTHQINIKAVISVLNSRVPVAA